MARVTVEDCIVKIPNRFELVMAAAHRAREIAAGAPLLVERDNDKNPVVALREIAENKLKPSDLKEAMIRGMQRQAEYDEAEDEEIADLFESEQRVLGVDPGEAVSEAVAAEDELVVASTAEMAASEAASEARNAENAEEG